LIGVLIPRDLMEAMRELTDRTVRESSNVRESNLYVFPSTQNSDNHVSGWHAVNRVCTAAELQHPERMTATKMRHRVSTLYAGLDVTQNERSLFYKHMGHSESINANVYQVPLAEAEVRTVGRRLREMDGQVKHSQPVAAQTAASISISQSLSSIQNDENGTSSSDGETTANSAHLDVESNVARPTVTATCESAEANPVQCSKIVLKRSEGTAVMSDIDTRWSARKLRKRKKGERPVITATCDSLEAEPVPPRTVAVASSENSATVSDVDTHWSSCSSLKLRKHNKSERTTLAELDNEFDDSDRDPHYEPDQDVISDSDNLSAEDSASDITEMPKKTKRNRKLETGYISPTKTRTGYIDTLFF